LHHFDSKERRHGFTSLYRRFPESQPVYIKQEEEDGFSLINPTQSKTERPPLSLPGEIAPIPTVCSAQLMTQVGLGQAIAPLTSSRPHLALITTQHNSPGFRQRNPSQLERSSSLLADWAIFMAINDCSSQATSGSVSGPSSLDLLSIVAPYSSIAVELLRVLVPRSYYRMGLRFSGQHIRLV
jgi:hypothetical protein